MTTRIPSDHAARTEALNVGHSFVVTSPAGSGKTELLAKRHLACLAVAKRPESVLSLTFTNKAAGEMAERIIKALLAAKEAEPDEPHKRETWALAKRVMDRSEAMGWGLEHNPDRLRVMTIDKLQAELASQLPIVSGLGAGGRIDDQPIGLYQDAVKLLLQEVDDQSTDSDVRDALKSLLGFAGNQVDRLFPKLSSLLGYRNQWYDIVYGADAEAMDALLADWVSTTIKPLIDELEPSLDEVIAHLTVAEATNELPVAVPNKQSLLAGDVDAWRAFASLFVSRSSMALYKRLTARQGFPAKEAPTKALNDWLVSMQGSTVFSDLLPSVLLLPDAQYPQRAAEFHAQLKVLLVRLIAYLKIVFAQSGRMDFVEVGLRARQALGDEGTTTDAIERADYSIEHILIDEAQDTSRAQIDLLLRLVEGWEQGDGRTVFFVGDLQQSIYRFRQAEVAEFGNLVATRAFGEISMTHLQLTENFRSTHTMVDWVNRVMPVVLPEAFLPWEGAVPFSPSVAFNQELSDGVTVNVYEGKQLQREARDVAQIIEKLIAQEPEATIAVLVRARSHLKRITPELQRLTIPYSATDIDPVDSKPVVRDLVSLFYALYHPLDDVHWTRVMTSRVVGLNWSDVLTVSQRSRGQGLRAALSQSVRERVLSSDGMDRALALIKALNDVDANPSVAHHLPYKTEAVFAQLGGMDTLNAVELRDVSTVFNVLHDSCEGGQVEDLAAIERKLSSIYAAPAPGRVDLLTGHKSKGLEWDYVIIPSMGVDTTRHDSDLLLTHAVPNGFLMVPHPGPGVDDDDSAKRLYQAVKRLDTVANRNESKRLLYVMLTRARKGMYLFGHLNENSKGLNPVANSFFDYLRAQVLSDDATRHAKAIEQSDEDALRWPVLRRVDQTVLQPAPEPVLDLDVHDRLSSPSERVIANNDDLLADGGDLFSRTVGIVYHHCMERMANDGVDAWDMARWETEQDSLAIACERNGLANGRKARAVKRVLRLLQLTLADETGRWCLEDHEEAQSELHLSKFIDGRWVSGVIDRTFVDQSKGRVVIDYKTTAMPFGLSVGEFSKAEQIKYQSNMRDYKDLIGDSDAATLLYYPEHGLLIEC